MTGKARAARLAAAFVLFAAGLYAAPKAAAAFRNVQAGAEVPGFALKDMGGNEALLDAYRKEKAVVIVFWATWSGRSLEELKDLKALAAEYGPNGLKILAVNVEHEHPTEEEARAVEAKAAELNLPFPVLLDAGLETFRSFGVVAVPSTAVLGEGGVLRAAVSGYPTSARLELRETVEALLGVKKEAAPAAVAAEAAYRPARAALLNYNLGRRLFALGMGEKAEPKLRAAAAADPKWAAPRILLGDIAMAKSRKDPALAQEAKKEFEAAAAADPRNPAARTGVARACFALGLFAEAEKEAAAALSLSPSYPPALFMRARIEAKKKNAAAAEEAVRAALELNPNDAAAHAEAGRVFEEAGDLGRAAAMYRKAWKLGGE